MSATRNPFAAGRWVCGSSFFGRVNLIRNLLDSNESCDWVVGKRRVGKTSLLRELEQRINADANGNFALFWDIQGSFDAEGLSDSLVDAIEDSRDEFGDHWSNAHQLPMEGTSPHILKSLARTLQRQDRRLVLLIDEAEEFISVGKQDPVLLGKLRKFFQSSRYVHTIISSTPRLEQFHKAVETETSPFLHGFNASYLGHLDQDACTRLLERGIGEANDRNAITGFTDGHPFETQLFAKHFFELGDLEKVVLLLEANPSMGQVIEVNFDLLTLEEQNILKDVFCGKTQLEAFDQPSEKALISKLLQLGYLALRVDQGLRINSFFQKQWLAAKFDHSPTFHAAHQSDPILESRHAGQLARQTVTVYKFFLELAQTGKRTDRPERCFKISNIDGSVYPNQDQIDLSDEERVGEPWQLAVRETANLLRQFCDLEGSWPVYRFCQMCDESRGGYGENDFLDLMMLISEEASLD